MYLSSLPPKVKRFAHPQTCPEIPAFYLLRSDHTHVTKPYALSGKGIFSLVTL
jgi:hypothetical protein